MIVMRYNTKLNTKPKIFKFYTPWELFFGAVMSMGPVMVTIISGAKPSPGDGIIVFCLYTIFLVYFKVGKPEGYLEHLIKHLFTPSNFRPGFKAPEFPVCPKLEDYVDQLAKTPEERKGELLNIQGHLVEVGILRTTRYGEYLKVNPEDPAAKPILDHARSLLAKEKILGVDIDEE
jgi:hypothetical protein